MEFVRKDFVRTYGASSKFVDNNNKYFTLFLELLKDDELLKNIKFVNDVLKIPPIKTFIVYQRDFLGCDVFNEKMSREEKIGLGACFGYLFRDLWGGYDGVNITCNDKQSDLKTASYFIKI